MASVANKSLETIPANDAWPNA